MSLILQKNSVFSTFKSLDSAVNYHTSHSARVSPLNRYKSKKFMEMSKQPSPHNHQEQDTTDRLSTFILPIFKMSDFQKTSPKIVMRNQKFHPQIKMSTPPFRRLNNYQDDIKINVYLNYLMKNQNQQTQVKQDTQVCISIMKQHNKSPTKKKNLNITQEIKDIERNVPTDISVMQVHGRFDNKLNSKIFGSQFTNQLASQTEIRQKKAEIVFATLQRITTEQQHNYDVRNADKIIALRKIVQELMKYITQLDSYINNKKKLFYVVKKLIMYNSNLKTVLMNENKDALIEPLNEQNLLKNMQRKDTQTIRSQSITVVKYDFSIQKDILSLIDQIQDFILSRRVDAYELMEKNIKMESRDIQQIEAQMLGQQTQKKLINFDTYIPVKHQEFSYKTLSMKQNNPHQLLENIEQRLGYSSNVTNSNRTVGKSIERLVSSLDNFQLSMIQNKLM